MFSLIESLPIDILEHVFSNLTRRDVANLSATSFSLCRVAVMLNLRHYHIDVSPPEGDNKKCDVTKIKGQSLIFRSFDDNVNQKIRNLWVTCTGTFSLSSLSTMVNLVHVHLSVGKLVHFNQEYVEGLTELESLTVTSVRPGERIIVNVSLPVDIPSLIFKDVKFFTSKKRVPQPNTCETRDVSDLSEIDVQTTTYGKIRKFSLTNTNRPRMYDFKKMTNVTDLTLSRVDIPCCRIIEGIRKMEGLTRLDLHDTDMNNSFYYLFLGRNETLTSLNIERCNTIIPGNFFGMVSRLSELKIKGNNRRYLIWKSIVEMRNLRSISFECHDTTHKRKMVESLRKKGVECNVTFIGRAS